MVDKLEACPFCGGEAQRYTVMRGFENRQVCCKSCGASAFDLKWSLRTTANGEQVEREDADVLNLRAERAAGNIPAPTTDARERVKVLEKALGNLLDFIGPKDMRVYATDLVVVEARTALGNKETDRHG